MGLKFSEVPNLAFFFVAGGTYQKLNFLTYVCCDTRELGEIPDTGEFDGKIELTKAVVKRPADQIKDLTAQNEGLQTQIAALKTRIQELEAAKVPPEVKSVAKKTAKKAPKQVAAKKVTSTKWKK